MIPLTQQYKQQIEELALAANRLAGLGYVTSHGGNLSARVDEDIVLITPTNMPKRDIKPEDICIVNTDGETLHAREGRKPTSELPFHLRVFMRRPDLKGIVHAHPPILSGFAIAGGDLLCKPYLPEPAIEIGPMVMVPYAITGSDALAEAFDEPLERSNGFLMENHGALMTSCEGVLHAVDQLEMMESAAQSVLVAMQLGRLKPLKDEDVKELGQMMAERGLPLPCSPGKYTALEDLFS